MAFSVEIENLGKSYGNTTALEDINLSVSKGELFGVIGPDGAGKTTLFRILTTLLLPDTGAATVEGLSPVSDYKKLRKILGYMPGKFSLYYDLTVEENLNFFATIFGTTIEANYNLIKDIYQQIEPFKNRRAGNLSGGMKQKLALSCAMIHKPEVLILDEPTTGVDAVSRKEFWEMLDRLKSYGITILVSTPYMDEAALCDRVALIQKGRIMKVDTPEAVMKSFGKPLFGVSSDNMFQLLYDLEQTDGVETAFRFGDKIHVSVSTDKPEKIVTDLEERGHKEISFEAVKATVEDCFMALMDEKDV